MLVGYARLDGQFDCDECRKGSCFTKGDVVTKSSKYDPETFTKDNWLGVVAKAKKDTGDDHTPYDSLALYSICPLGLITSFSYYVHRMYYSCDGFRRITCPDDFNKLAPTWIDCVNVIDAEISRINKLRKKKP